MPNNPKWLHLNEPGHSGERRVFPNDAGKYLDGTGEFSVPPGGAGGGSGPMGPPGTDGIDGEPGPPGSSGSAGAAGATGAPGAGLPGPPGNDGEEGEQGIPGQSGPAGSSGSQGAQGVQGSLGPPGLDGMDGADGDLGPQGQIGAQGVQGIQGSQGNGGIPGLDGSEGEPGPPGPKGDTGATGAPGGGGGSATTVEVNLGATEKWSGKFTITDAAIGATSKVLAWQAPGPYTGKGTRADEAEMQPVSVIAVEPATGSAVVKWQTPPMLRQERRSYQRLATVAIEPRELLLSPPVRLGKVRGNVKFSYLVFA